MYVSTGGIVNDQISVCSDFILNSVHLMNLNKRVENSSSIPWIKCGIN